MQPRIRINGPYAELSGITSPTEVLHAALSVLDPKRFFNHAFRQRRWDGKVRFHEGKRFPAGLTPLVVAHLRELGYETKVTAAGGGPLAVEVKPDCVAGKTLWDHQLAGVRAIMQKARGHLELPTGSGKTALIAAAARYFWIEFGWRTLVMTSKKGIGVQTWRAISEMIGEDVDVGIAGDGLREDGEVIVATAQTLQNFQDRWMMRSVKGRKKKKRVRVEGQRDLREIIEQADVLILDECHHTSSDSWFEIAMACQATRRYGLSGTATKDDDISDRRMLAATGPRIHVTHASALIENGLAAKPKIAMVMSPNASGPTLPEVWDSKSEKSKLMPYDAAYRAAIVDSREHNVSVVRATQWLIERGRRVLVLCRKKDHFRTLSSMFDSRRLRIEKVWGETETAERDRVKAQFAAGKIDAVLATTIWDEGEDVSGVDAIVLAEGVKVETSSIQRIGRGMRRDSEDVWVVDIVPTSHKVLTQHALKRCEAYEERGYEVTVVDDWPKVTARVPDDLLPFEEWDRIMSRLAVAS